MPMILQNDLQQYTYEYMLTEALARVPDTVDKRVGSIIWDALAPACYELAIFYQNLYNVTQEVYYETSSGEWLDKRAAEQGLVRFEAEPAIRRGDFTDTVGNPKTIPIGSRFSTISDGNPIMYIVTGEYQDSNGDTVLGSYELTCETAGIIGGEYSGNIIPIDYINDIGTAVIVGTINPGRDIESDEDLRERYKQKVNTRAFSGNIAAYREMMLAIPGVGGVQIYPVWNGGGTVKLSVIGSDKLTVTQDFLSALQETVDPDNVLGGQGQGLGLAPIDHFVTIVTPNEYVVNVEAEIILSSGYTLGQVQFGANNAINDYLASVRNKWDNTTQLNTYSSIIYYSQIISALLTVTGIDSVTKLTINNIENTDFTLTENAELQQIPVLGEVHINGSAL